MNITPPPWWQSLLLEDPLPLAFALAVVAITLRLVASRRGKPALNYAALGVIALAAGAFLLANYTQTDREAILERTEALVHATAPINAATVTPYLAAGVNVTGPDGRVIVPEAALRDRLESASRRYTVREHAILASDASADGDRGISEVHIRTQAEASVFQGAITSKWGLVWRRTGDGVWRVQEIRWLELQGQHPPGSNW